MEKKKNEEYRLYHPTTRECCYCENYLACSKNKFSKHLKRKWTSIERIVYSFDNNKIISFQGNFKYLGDVPFTVYFHIQTTTADDIFQDPKMFVISYCQIFAFHPALDLDRIVIFRSFHQSAEEIFDLNHFGQEHISFFDKVMSHQLKDAATAAIIRETSTSLSEFFSIELKLTIDTLKSWFKNTTKSKFLELNDIEKQLFVNENATILSKTISGICGFLRDIEGASGDEDNKKIWYNFLVEKEHLFIRNIYCKENLGEMKDTNDISDYHEKFKLFIKIVMLFGKRLDNYRMEENHLLEEFFHYDYMTDSLTWDKLGTLLTNLRL